AGVETGPILPLLRPRRRGMTGLCFNSDIFRGPTCLDPNRRLTSGHRITRFAQGFALPKINEQQPATFPKIGVLALQGDFDAHRKRLEELSVEVVLVKKPEQLDEIDGLVIPGGESSAFLKLLGEAGFQKLRDFVRVKPTFGTCAGAILLAKEV